MDRTRSLHGAALFVLACMPACGGRSDLFAPEAQDCRQLPGVWSKRVGSEGGESRAADVVLHDGRVVVAGFQMDPPLVPGAPSATLMSYEERSGKLSTDPVSASATPARRLVARATSSAKMRASSTAR